MFTLIDHIYFNAQASLKDSQHLLLMSMLHVLLKRVLPAVFTSNTHSNLGPIMNVYKYSGGRK